MNKNFSHLKPKKLPRDAAIVQYARNYTIKEITKLVSNTTAHDAWMTKYNREELGLPKQHYYDALSVGEIPSKFNFLTDKVLQISAKASKSVKGFQTGDMVKAVVTKGSKIREYLGRVAVRSKRSFDIKTKSGLVKDIGYRYCHLIQRGDGYLYNYQERS